MQVFSLLLSEKSQVIYLLLNVYFHYNLALKSNHFRVKYENVFVHTNKKGIRFTNALKIIFESLCSAQ